MKSSEVKNGDLALLERRRQKLERELAFAQDPIDLRSLPEHLVTKARNIISALSAGQNYRQFDGKKLRYDRSKISIPLNRDYRLICRDCEDGIVPYAVLSHEEYNICKPGR